MEPQRPHYRPAAKTAMIVPLLALCTAPVLAQLSSKTAVYSLSGKSGTLLTLKVPMDTLFARTNKILIGNRSHHRLADYLTRVI